MSALVLLASFYDREEALVAKTALDSAGLFVVLNGLDRVIAMPALRGAAPLELYGLEQEQNEAVALLSWRAPGAGALGTLGYFRASVRDRLWVLFTFLLGLFGGVPFMIGWPRRLEP